VLARLPVRDKKQALKQLAAFASRRANLPEREIYQVLMARENLGCTGMGGGVCIPHGRFEDLSGIQAVLATLEEPIDFGAADGRPVDIICLLLTPLDANTEHLKALAVLSRLLRDKELCARLRSAPDDPSLQTTLIHYKPE
jgi:PTS system nitrogen regulatory IIA component